MFVHSLAVTQIKAHLMENIATNCSQVTVPVLAGWTKKPILTLPLIKYPMPSTNLSDAESKRFSS